MLPASGDTRKRQETPLFAKSIERHVLSTNTAAAANAQKTISAHRMSDHSMKRTYFPGITDIVVVTDPAEIRTISNDSRFDRDFIGRGPVRNVQLLRKMLRIFSLNGRLFSIMLPRTNPS